MKDKFLELVERCEQATGPDRELDASIFKALGAPVPFQFFNKLVALTFDEAEQCYFAPIGDMRVRYEPPTYTASLDAAMTLVPEGMMFCVTNVGVDHPTKPDLSRSSAIVGKPDDPKRGYNTGATPALALCAAALRARASAMADQALTVEA
jgi:hypothetical protein